MVRFDLCSVSYAILLLFGGLYRVSQVYCVDYVVRFFGGGKIGSFGIEGKNNEIVFGSIFLLFR